MFFVEFSIFFYCTAKACLLRNFLTASRNRLTLGQKLRGGENKNLQVVALRIRVPRVCKNEQNDLKGCEKQEVVVKLRDFT